MLISRLVSSSSKAPATARQTFTGRLDPVGFSILQMTDCGTVGTPTKLSTGAGEWGSTAQPLAIILRITNTVAFIIQPSKRYLDKQSSILNGTDNLTPSLVRFSITALIMWPWHISKTQRRVVGSSALLGIGSANVRHLKIVLVLAQLPISYGAEIAKYTVLHSCAALDSVSSPER